MKIVACVKATPDEQDITANADGSLNLDRAAWKIGAYDLNALEAARTLASDEDQVIGLSVGGSALEAPKLRKDVLSRGLDRLVIVDSHDVDLDSFQTATLLKKAIEDIGGVDLVLLGAGSSDRYTQQVGNVLGALLGWVCLNSVNNLLAQGDGLRIDRQLDDRTQVIDVSLPAVISVTSSINTPRIASMKDILAAGKKPVEQFDPAPVPESSLTVLTVRAPQPAPREGRVLEGDPVETAATLAAFIKNL